MRLWYRSTLDESGTGLEKKINVIYRGSGSTWRYMNGSKLEI